MKMSRTKSMLALAAGSVFAGSAAQASVTPLPNLVPVAIPSSTGTYAQAGSPQVGGSQGADDAALAGFCTYDIQVVVSSTSSSIDRFSSADLRAQLGIGGMFYIPPSNSGAPTDSNVIQVAGTRNAVGKRYLQVDTMIMVPSVSSGISIQNKSTFAPASQTGQVFPSNGSNLFDQASPNQTAFLPANDMSLVDSSWTVNVPNNTPTSGTFTIARLTIKQGSSGTFIGRIGSLLAPSNPVTFTYVLGVPEPTSVALMGLGLGAVALRRRK
jgi:hypothetical protein